MLLISIQGITAERSYEGQTQMEMIQIQMDTMTQSLALNTVTMIAKNQLKAHQGS